MDAAQQLLLFRIVVEVTAADGDERPVDGQAGRSQCRPQGHLGDQPAGGVLARVVVGLGHQQDDLAGRRHHLENRLRRRRDRLLLRLADRLDRFFRPASDHCCQFGRADVLALLVRAKDERLVPGRLDQHKVHLRSPFVRPHLFRTAGDRAHATVASLPGPQRCGAGECIGCVTVPRHRAAPGHPGRRPAGSVSEISVPTHVPDGRRVKDDRRPWSCADLPAVWRRAGTGEKATQGRGRRRRRAGAGEGPAG